MFGAKLAGLGVGDPGQPVLAGRLDGRAGYPGQVTAQPRERKDSAWPRGSAGRRAEQGEVGSVRGAADDGDLSARLDLQFGGEIHASIIHLKCVQTRSPGNPPG